jgi:hypothetical protein
VSKESRRKYVRENYLLLFGIFFLALGIAMVLTAPALVSGW